MEQANDRAGRAASIALIGGVLALTAATGVATATVGAPLVKNAASWSSKQQHSAASWSSVVTYSPGRKI